MKRTALIALTVLLAAACGKEIVPDNTVSDGTVTLQAGFVQDETKVNVSDAGALTWKANDQIAVWTSNGSDGKFVTFTLSSGAGESTASFTGTPDTGYSPSAIAVYPAEAAKSYTDGNLTVNYPDSYSYNEGAENVRMAAWFTDASAGLQFAHLGGMIRFTIDNIPASANSFKLVSSKTVAGDFAIGTSKSAEAADGESAVTISFTAGSITNGTFNVPVPVGEGFSFTAGLYKDDTAIEKTIRTTTKDIGRKDYLQMKAYTVSDIWYVKPDGTGHGSSWADATSLEKALASAEDGETIKVAAGTYTAATSLNNDDANWKVFWIRTACTVEGGYEGVTENETSDPDRNVTTIDANGSYHALVINTNPSTTKTAHIKGFTLKGGKSASSSDPQVDGNDAHLSANIGAGILVRGGDALIESCTIKENNPSAAGSNKAAIYLSNASGKTTTIRNCILNGDSNESVGIIVGGEIVNVENTTISGFNSGSTVGSAIIVNAGTANVNNCDVISNVKGSATQQGIIFNKAELNITGGSISNNTALSIIYNWQTGNTTLKNVKVENNDAGSGHGGVILNKGTLTVDGCSFANNTHKDGRGSVLYSYYDANNSTYSYITNSSFTDNTNTWSSGTTYGHLMYFTGPARSIIANCTFVGNSSGDPANDGVRGTFCIGSTSKIYFISSTITGNTANQLGAFQLDGSSSEIYLYNTVIAGNIAKTSSTKWHDMNAAAAVVKAKQNCALGTGGAAYAIAHFYDSSSADVFTSTAHYQYTGNGFAAAKAVGNGTTVVPVAAAERKESNYETNLWNAGMTSAQLIALNIDLGQGVWDNSILAYDQAGNSRSGLTTIGAYVGE